MEMAKPPSLSELLGLKGVMAVAVADEKKLAQKKQQLMAANKLAARALLLGISTGQVSQVTATSRES
jgi:hypothetical protein